MLAALELNGFKSFADRTRFELPAGITVVVGPNGSGKSNVVDAIKWVLGTQSIKSLRGKEGTDVIFSGSASRRAANAAEATLVFDNSSGLLDHDAAEVHLTRRTYRSGETEYLINRQPCRLRDLRDVLAGIGMAGGAYSIIEQGKVDAVLQASPKERRLIFEEAAGIGRFRVKREEAVRRMERVEQSLLRLSDIVQELDSRLRSVRSQAGKARRYTDLSQRLAHLRTGAGRAEWRRLSGQIQTLQTRAEADGTARDAVALRVHGLTARLALVDEHLEQIYHEGRRYGAEDADLRERLAQLHSTRSSHLARGDELEQEVARLERQVETLASRAGDSRELVESTDGELATATAQLDELAGRLAELETAAAPLEATLLELAEQTVADRSRLEAIEDDRLKLAAAVQRHDAEEQSAGAVLLRCEEQCSDLESDVLRCEELTRASALELTARTAELDAAAAALASSQQSLEADRVALTSAHRRVAELRGRLAGAGERIAVLEELERRLDGLAAGAKEVLRRSREEPQGPFGAVHGVVADLLCVDADSAALVEIALGERANFLVVDDVVRLAPALVGDPGLWPGRTSFLRLDVAAPASAVDRVDLSAEPGVMGRADSFVEADGLLAPLVRRLLGRHWFVDTLETALRLSIGVGRGLNFVTSAGETVLADGALTVGPRHSLAGLLSRRTELRTLREQILKLEGDEVEADANCRRLEEVVERGGAEVRRLAARHGELLHHHGEARLAATSAAQELAQLERRRQSLQAQREECLRQIADVQTKRGDADSRRLRIERESAEIRTRLENSAAAESTLRDRREELRQVSSELRVELARLEQRVEGLRRQKEQLLRDHDERDRTLAATRDRAQQCASQKLLLQQQALQLVDEIERYEVRKEELLHERRLAETLHDLLRSMRQSSASVLEGENRKLADAQRSLELLRLEVLKLEQSRSSLADRLREDYKIDVEQLASADLADEDSAAETGESKANVEREIAELKEQLSAAGPVNLEAVAELDSLESRRQTLARQQQDLVEARDRLRTAIDQINDESRKLFTETIDQVRGHFQEIFGRLFAGGEADIVVEADDSGDILESGVSIIARPPGKQPRSISLLSGGERTLTCVALLLAMFRSRPSPFCVLDEVDAALDEANIGRFVDVLKQFMHTTQFIVITHSKRTMACSDTLYGVTMQETGVSKRVSVRFEDVGEGGRIRESAAKAAETNPSAKAA